MKQYIYVLLPFISWLIAGSTKFLVNSLRFKGEGFKRIGNGGFPSTHTTIVTSVVMFLGLQWGFFTPYFLLAITFFLITIIDAMGIRRTVGRHAQILNSISKNDKKLRTLQGHKPYEVLGGIILGIIIGLFFYYILL